MTPWFLATLVAFSSAPALAIDMDTLPEPYAIREATEPLTSTYGLHPTEDMTLPLLLDRQPTCDVYSPANTITIQDDGSIQTTEGGGSEPSIVFADADTPIAHVFAAASDVDEVRAAAVFSALRPPPRMWCGPRLRITVRPKGPRFDASDIIDIRDHPDAYGDFRAYTAANRAFQKRGHIVIRLHPDTPWGDALPIIVRLL